MSATKGTSQPCARSELRIMPMASACRTPCAVKRTISPPASTMRRHCSALRSTSSVMVLVIDCILTGHSLPIGTLPTFTVSVERRL